MPVIPTASAPARFRLATSSWFTLPAKTFNTASTTSGRGHAQPVDEPAFHAALGQEAGHLLAAAVDHHQFDAPPASRDDLFGQRARRVRRIEQRAPQLYQQLHSRPSVSGNPSIRFMFWTACPAAPFTRLSMALTTTARPVAGSNDTPMSQKLVRATPRRSGTCPG